MTEQNKKMESSNAPSHAPPELIEKFWENVQEAAKNEDQTSGTKVRTGRISGPFKSNSRADIIRDYADTPDGMEYAVIAGGMKPLDGDPVVFLDGEGGPVILGKMWRPGDPDLVQVDLKAENAQDDADDAMIVAQEALDDANHNHPYAPSGHDHDERYYTESQADSRFASSGHSHSAGDLPSAIVYANEMVIDVNNPNLRWVG